MFKNYYYRRAQSGLSVQKLALYCTVDAVCAVDRMLYWSVGGGGTAARYIYRSTLDGAAADKVQQFVDVTDDSVTAAAAAAVQDIVIDVRTRRLALSAQNQYTVYRFKQKMLIFQLILNLPGLKTNSETS